MIVSNTVTAPTVNVDKHHRIEPVDLETVPNLSTLNRLALSVLSKPIGSFGFRTSLPFPSLSLRLGLCFKVSGP